ncbi:MAG: ferredoxin [Leptolyngbyaceae cyanobacterium]
MPSNHFRTPETHSSQHFCLEGQFLGFAPGKKSPFKYLQVMTTDGIVPIKLRKSLQLMLFRYLVPGDWVRAVGQQKWDDEQDGMRLKADEVVRIATPTVADGETTVSDPDSAFIQIHDEALAPTTAKEDSSGQSPKKAAKAKAKPVKILICQKSSCRKRGAGVITDRVERSLQEMGLSGKVTVKYTGCMDRCKAGPNVVFMPDKAKYTRVKPNMVPDLMQQHCGVTDPRSTHHP